MQKHQLRILRSLTLSILIILFISACTPQDDDDTPIEFTGEITVISGNTVTVGGFTVDISNASVPTTGLIIGDTVRVTGLSQGNVIIAVVVVPVESSDDDSEATEVAQNPTPIPVETNEVEITPEATTEVEGTAEATTEPEMTPEATAEPDVIIIDGEPIIVIEGPVQEININSIQIFDIDIQVDPADPILTQIRIGDTIRIEGQSSFEGTTIVIIAINIVIIETSTIIINNPVYVIPGVPANCRTTPRGRVTCRNTHHSSRSSRSSRGS